MELSVKQCLRQGIRSLILLVGGLLSWVILSQLCFATTANSLQSLKQQVSDTSIEATYQPTDEIVDVTDEVEYKVANVTNGMFVGLTDNLSVAKALTDDTFVGEIDKVSVTKQTQDEAPKGETDNLSVTSVTPYVAQNSVSELSDVQPTDWAYQALRSLMEKYGVISGYSDGTFRGNRPLSRYEFAAALAATLDKVDKLIVDAVGDQFIQEDLVTLRRLQREYRSALDQLQGSLDKIGDRTTQLEANQFSTTTKLNGQFILAFTEGSNATTTLISRVRLNFLTSFHSQDLLFTQLEAGNNGLDAIGRAQQKNVNLLGATGFLANGGGLDYIEVDSGVSLRRLYYTFRPVSDLAVTVGAKMSPRDFIDRNSYANNEAADFSSGFFLNNPLIVQNQIDRTGGAGVAVAWNPSGGPFTIRSLYIAADADRPDSSITEGGLFGDRYQGSVELEYSPSNQFALRLQYTSAEINNTDISAFGVNAEYSLNRHLGIFTRLGFGNYQGFNTAINQDLDLSPFSWAVGVGVRNLFLPGTTVGVAIGQPFVTDELGNANQTNFEAFYNLELSDNISITPTLSVVTNADNSTSNNTIWQGTLRTVILF
jgi:Carbohydrate-selective porin, OprB family/S-layer homology domain